jgi:hypothetical protein
MVRFHLLLQKKKDAVRKKKYASSNASVENTEELNQEKYFSDTKFVKLILEDGAIFIS